MTPLQLIAFGVLFLRSDAQPWNCAAAERCALSLERDFEETIANKNDSFTINFCLKKTKEFRTVCLTNATISCKWGGNEDEYYRLQDLQRKFQQKCSELCPVTKEIQACSGLVDYPAYINRKFQDFCDSYKRSVNCKDQALAGDTNCSFGEKLYLLDFDQNTLHVFNYICNSGCEDIDTAWAVLERCTSTHNLDNAAPGCKTYQDLELCLSTSKSCPQIHMMAPYFARKYTEYMSICPLPMPVRTSTTTPTPVQTSTASLEQETTLDSEPDEYLTVKDLITTVVSTIHSAIIMSSSTKDISTGLEFGECLTSVAPLGLLYGTVSDLCDSVRCLKRKGMVPDEISSVNLQKDLKENLIAAWDSCEIQSRSKTTITTSGPELSQGLHNGSPSVSSLDIVLYVTALISVWYAVL
ncbi:uncharacterized protein LOC125663676 isoform X2 [Ostrea edulis]|uniref:uncharacterized protein LOC125663676 isoform X2 n=1 Tax=Ostrea edulis TaxID=37623 RepID=UPI00209642B3|nr:uncharacterized protein LOC125663676 isoform X2 [Ostrea edulis]